MIFTFKTLELSSAFSVFALILSLFDSTAASLTQGCTHPHKSPIDWRPKANDSRIFQVGLENAREIRVRIPANYNGSATMLPLILAFHDKDMSTAEMEYQTRLSDPKANNDFILVYPTAKNNTWQSDISVRRWQKNQDVKKNYTDDVAFVARLLDDIDTVICFDDSKIHATGLGTGAGMVHLLACDPKLSNRIASFATVAGGYGHPSKAKHWKDCNPARVPIPLLSIHGDDDMVLPYLLNEWEPAKSRLAVPTWLDEWSERNGCGEALGDPMDGTDGTGTAVQVTKLDGGGWISQGEAYNGAALRIAKSCPGGKPDREDTEAFKRSEAGIEDDVGGGTLEYEGSFKEEILTTNPADFTILHYRLRNYGHGWPTLRIKGSKSGSVEERFFDATALVLDWFKMHELPIEWTGERPSPRNVNTGKDQGASNKDASSARVNSENTPDEKKAPMDLSEEQDEGGDAEAETETEDVREDKDEL